MPKKKRKTKKTKKTKVKASKKKELTPEEQQNLPESVSQKFKGLVKSYDRGEYLKGIKEADRILQDYPFNGETLAFKGLCVLNQKDEATSEAEEYIKEGVKRNMKSHLCWHAYGMLHRHTSNYAQAGKCLAKALQITLTDKEDEDISARILVDLSQVNIHERQYELYGRRRDKLLEFKSNQKQNWYGVGVSSFLVGKLDRCVKVLDSWLETSKSKTTRNEELNQVIFLQTQAKHDMGDIEEALSFLRNNEQYLTNTLDFKHYEADFLEKLEQYSEAIDVYRELIERNPENEIYYNGIIRCSNQAPEIDMSSVIELYDEFSQENPKSDVPQRIPLSLTSGDEFRERLDRYLRAKLRKSVPSTFNLIKTILQDEEKREIMEGLINQYIDQLHSHCRFSEDDAMNSERVSVILWVYYLYGMFLDHFNRPQEAFDIIETALGIAPTCIDFLMLRGRIYKHQGNFLEGYRWMEEARSNDTADRFLNTKCARYAHRAGCPINGQWTFRLFLRPNDGVEVVEDLQVLWYTLASAVGYAKFNRYTDTLRECERIYYTYENVFNDQFDFHNYALRKATLLTYIKMLEWEDNLRQAPKFVKAAKIAIRTYCRVFDLQEQGIDIESEVKELPEDEPPAPIPEDKKTRYMPESFLETPLQGAERWVNHLKTVMKHDIDTFSLMAAVYRRQKKWIPLQLALKAGSALEPENPYLLREIFLFLLDIENGVMEDKWAKFIDTTLFSQADNSLAFIEYLSELSSGSFPLKYILILCKHDDGQDVRSELDELCQVSGSLKECIESFEELNRRELMTSELLVHLNSLWPFCPKFQTD